MAKKWGWEGGGRELTRRPKNGNGGEGRGQNTPKDQKEPRGVIFIT